MLELTTWGKAIERDQGGACHGPTGGSMRLGGINADINSITVSKENNGYCISLEVIFELSNDLTKEQVVEKLRELQALDNEWE